jgi:MFS family permease
MAGSASLQNAIDAWKQRNFAWYMGGATVSLVGLWAQKIAVGWLAWDLTHSELWLGFIAFADLFPTVVITPIAGALADRGSRLAMARISQSLAGLISFALAGLFYADLLTIWPLFFLSLALGVVLAFATAARLALVPVLLEPQYVPAAVANDGAIYNACRVVGPMIAAAIIAVSNVGGAFLINGCCFAIFVLCLLKVRILRVETSARAAGNVLQQTMDGVRYAANHPGIGPILVVLTAVAVGVKPFLEMLPALADVVFDAGVDGFAWLAAAGGFGAVVAALWLAARGTVEGLTKISLSALLFGSGGIVLVAATDIFWVGLIGAVIAGSAITLSGTGCQTLMQNAVDGAVRGRVMSLYGMLHRGAPALGALAVGAAAEIIGLQLAIAGSAVLLCVAGLVFALPRLKTMIPALEDPDH